MLGENMIGMAHVDAKDALSAGFGFPEHVAHLAEYDRQSISGFHARERITLREASFVGISRLTLAIVPMWGQEDQRLLPRRGPCFRREPLLVVVLHARRVGQVSRGASRARESLRRSLHADS